MSNPSWGVVKNKCRIWPSDLGALRRFKLLMWLIHISDVHLDAVELLE